MDEVRRDFVEFPKISMILDVIGYRNLNHGDTGLTRRAWRWR